jgi:hypothetical protein
MTAEEQDRVAASLAAAIAAVVTQAVPSAE